LIERYQRAHAGLPQFVLLHGEAGIGKTRLATEFLGWAQVQGADVLVGRALQTGRQLPYQPFIDVLRRHLEQEHAPDDLGSPVWLAELSRLQPELRFVQGLAWAEQQLQVESMGSSERGSQHGAASLSREDLLPFATWLYFQTRGQPLYLVETLKGLLARGIIVPSLQQHGCWGLVLLTGPLAQTPVGELIPASVRELIRSQLARLTPSAWEFLVAGAALEQGLTFERLIKVAQLDEQEGLLALEELLRKGLLCEVILGEDSQAGDGYAFPREMLRAVVYQEAGTTRQRLVQRRASIAMREEEARLLHPAPDNEYTSAEARNGQGHRDVARAVGRDMYRAGASNSSGATSILAGAGTGEQTLLSARDACGKCFPDFPRSPPGRPFQGLF
jgi:hypothetical protein